LTVTGELSHGQRSSNVLLRGKESVENEIKGEVREIKPRNYGSDMDGKG